ncbi:MAG: SUMF1/EgtB/PvdO family nonheme iron enzyme, partial [Gammaproteobacteria bacterium]|nr:SUMF1/EgtB/PvdO family nonheme iron enzyme [Gammaproteobacteria bacterium]
MKSVKSVDSGRYSTALYELIEDLRLSGYNIGAAQHIVAQNLLLALEARNELRDPYRLRSLLGPALCSTPEQQAEFQDRFEVWAGRFAESPPSAPDAAESELDKLEHGARAWMWAVIMVLSLAAAAISAHHCGLWDEWFPQQMPEQTRPVEPDKPDTPPVENSGDVQKTPATDTGPANAGAAMPQKSDFRLTPAQWRAVVLFPALLLLGGALWWWTAASGRYLDRRYSNHIQDLQSVFPPDLTPGLFDSPVFIRLAQNLGLHTRTPSGCLDVAATVKESARSGGRFTPVSGFRRLRPVYLALIERHGFQDHNASLMDILLGRLAEHGILLERYAFSGDPRLCHPLDRAGPSLTLDELIGCHASDRLLIFADGKGFLDTRGNRPAPWLEKLNAWPLRVLFTREIRPVRLLEETGLLVLSADADGLDVLSGYIKGEIRPVKVKMRDMGPLPLLLRERPIRLLQRQAPRPETMDKLLRQIRAFLGADTMDWFRACAVYPELHWPLTLYLGHQLPAADESPCLNEARLAQLVRLPWFRHGYMPDWLRVRLIDGLSPERERDIRTALFQLLLYAPVAEKPLSSSRKFHLEIASPRFFGLLGRRLLSRLRKQDDEHSPWADYVFQTFTQNPLRVKIPKLLRRMLRKKRARKFLLWGTIFSFVPLLAVALALYFMPELKCVAVSPCVFQDRLESGGQGPAMVWIPPGSFRMGDIQGKGLENARPVHRVRLNAFALGRYEVTFEEYDRFCEAAGREKPVDAGWGRSRRPVINVSWEDAQAYAQWLSKETGHDYRLPAEAQWEYAARAGGEDLYYWGDNPDEACGYENVADETFKQELDLLEWDIHNCTDGYADTAPVGQFEANEFSLYDMSGNVYEWVWDWYDKKYYARSPEENPEGPESGAYRVTRGGNLNNSPRYVHSANRWGTFPGNRHSNIGFRLARLDPLPLLPFYPPKPEAQAPEMVFIPGGKFRMGDIQGDGESNEKPVHEITLGEFFIGKYEVKVGEFRRFVEEKTYETEAEKEGSCWSDKDGDRGKGLNWRNPGFEQAEDHPVVCVSWNDAKVYIQWLNTRTSEKYRLPTEAEWEYVARAKTETVYWWGDEASHEHANYGKDSCCEGVARGKDRWIYTAPTGSFVANSFGAQDIAGNVWEWVQDWYGDDYYAKSPAKNPPGPKAGVSRVIRGSGWFDTPHHVRSAYRSRHAPGLRFDNLGFRLARAYPRSPNPEELKSSVEVTMPPKLAPIHAEAGKTAEIEKKLQECRRHDKARRWTATVTKKGTAVPCFYAVLQMDRNNDEARAGLIKIAQKYLEKGEKASYESEVQLKKVDNYQTKIENAGLAGMEKLFMSAKEKLEKTKGYLKKIEKVNPDAPVLAELKPRWETYKKKVQEQTRRWNMMARLKECQGHFDEDRITTTVEKKKNTALDCYEEIL